MKPLRAFSFAEFESSLAISEKTEVEFESFKNLCEIFACRALKVGYSREACLSYRAS